MSAVDGVPELLDEAIEAMSCFPRGFVPTASALPDVTPMAAPSVTALLRRPAVMAHLRERVEQVPDTVFRAFVACTGAIGQLLSGYGVRHDSGRVNYMIAATLDPELMSLMLMAAKLHKDAAQEPAESGDDQPSFIPRESAMMEVLQQEVNRRALRLRMPYSATLATLLGPDVFQWLTAPSQSGHSKLQMHELSRVGWADLDSIGNQLKIESELARLDADHSPAAKSVVALAWTVVALASFVDPSIFIGDHAAYVSSLREHRLSWSSGIGTHTIIEYLTESMIDMVRVLARGLREPEITACDLMWIAMGVARRRSVTSGHGGPLQVREQRFSVFVSHRGPDAKQMLAAQLASAPLGRAFLDCLVLAKGIVNRRFVFESLARSGHCLIVETANYAASPWCRKERWLAETLSQLGLMTIERRSLAAALVALAAERPADASVAGDFDHQYPITDRVLSDIDYWGRAPNRHSLTESGEDTSCLDPLAALVASEQHPCEVDPHTAVSAIHSLFRTVAQRPVRDAFDLWSTAAQYAVAAKITAAAGPPAGAGSMSRVARRDGDWLIGTTGARPRPRSVLDELCRP